MKLDRRTTQSKRLSPTQLDAYRPLDDYQKAIVTILQTSFGARSVAQIAAELRDHFASVAPKEKRQPAVIVEHLAALIESGLIKRVKWPTQTAYKFNLIVIDPQESHDAAQRRLRTR